MYRFLGLIFVFSTPLLALSYGCNCSDDDPPRRDECDTPDDEALVTSLMVTGEHVYGFQGGQHVQARVFVEGSGLGTCTTFEAWIESPDGGRTHVTSGGLPLMGSDTSARSAEIYFFVDSAPSADARVAVTMLGETASTCIGVESCEDAGTEVDAGESESVDAADSGHDAEERDADESDSSSVDAADAERDADGADASSVDAADGGDADAA